MQDSSVLFYFQVEVGKYIYSQTHKVELQETFLIMKL